MHPTLHPLAESSAQSAPHVPPKDRTESSSGGDGLPVVMTSDGSDSHYLVKYWRGFGDVSFFALFGVQQLLSYIAAIGPEPVDDVAEGYPHPEIEGATCVPLADGRVAVIDTEDYCLVKRHAWHANGGGYAVTDVCFGGSAVKLTMHRLVLLISPEADGFVDHISRDRLDNRKTNLRRCTRQQNMCNTPWRGSNTGIKGVSKVAWGYVAGVGARGKRHQKRFRDLEDAVAWVRQTRERLHGEFTRHE